jgi:hypothetical protein
MLPVLCAADDAPTRSVIITDAEGKSRTGLLTDLGSGQLTLGHIEQVRLNTRNQVLLKIKDRTSAIAPADPLVVLAGGDMLVLRAESINDESLTARWTHFPTWPPVKLPLDAVRSLLLNRPPRAAAGARLFNQVLEYGDPQDAIIMANGDTLAGEFVALDESSRDQLLEYLKLL